MLFPLQNLVCKILAAANRLKCPSWFLSVFRQQLQNTPRISCSRAASPCPMLWAGFQTSYWVSLQVCLLRARLVWQTSQKTPGMLLWWGNLVGLSWKKKQSTALKIEEGLAVSRCVGRGKDIPELHIRACMKQGSWGLQTPCSTTPSPCWAAWKTWVHDLWDIYPCMPNSRLIFPVSLGMRAQHFPAGMCSPLPKRGLAFSPSVQEGQPARHPQSHCLLPGQAPKGGVSKVFQVHWTDNFSSISGCRVLLNSRFFYEVLKWSLPSLPTVISFIILSQMVWSLGIF